MLIKYTACQGRISWPLPADIDLASLQVRVLCEGMERNLVAGKDYQIKGNKLFWLGQEGCELIVFDNKPNSQTDNIAIHESNASAGISYNAAQGALNLNVNSIDDNELEIDNSDWIEPSEADLDNSQAPYSAQSINQAVLPNSTQANDFAQNNQALLNKAELAAIRQQLYSQLKNELLNTQGQYNGYNFAGTSAGFADCNFPRSIDSDYSGSNVSQISAQAKRQSQFSQNNQNLNFNSNAARRAMSQQTYSTERLANLLEQLAPILTNLQNNANPSSLAVQTMDAKADTENPKIAALEAKLDQLLEARKVAEVEALEIARAAKADAQIQAVEEAGANALAQLEEARKRIARETANRTATLAEVTELASDENEIADQMQSQVHTLVRESLENIENSVANAETRLNTATLQATKAASEVQTQSLAAEGTFNQIATLADQTVKVAAETAETSGEAKQYAALAERSAQNAAQSAQNAETAANTARDKLGQIQSIADNVIGEIDEAGTTQIRNIEAEADTAIAALRTSATQWREDSVNVWTTATNEIRKEANNSSAAARELWQKAQKAITDTSQAWSEQINNQAGEAVNRIVADGQKWDTKVISDGQAQTQAIATARAKAQTAAETASQKAESEKLRAEQFANTAKELAQYAWAAARDASLRGAKPGISTVHEMDDLQYAVTGCYLLNPLIQDKPPFMGIYPVESMDDMNFDGVFFIGKPYPVPPALPEDLPYPSDPANTPGMEPGADPPLPDLPEPGINTASAEWLPCGHSHN